MTQTFNLSFAISILPALLEGLLLTVNVTIASAFIAAVLGFFLFLARYSTVLTLNRLSRMLINFVRSTPLLVQLYFFYFALPELGFDLPQSVAGSCVLGTHYACYTAEVYRAAYQAVGNGQHEAANALGLHSLQRMRLVILPQMLPVLLPGMGNALIALLKDAPALSAISVAEMMLTAKIIGSDTFRYLEPMTLCGLIYFAVSTCIAFIIRGLQRRVRWTAAR